MKPVLSPQLEQLLSEGPAHKAVPAAETSGTTTGAKAVQVQPAARKAEAPAREAQADTSKKGRALLAEDNAINQKIASKLLAKAGYEADVVDNGAAAVDAMQKNAYDFILMDCQMPEMDGFEATAVIRQMEGDRRHIRIIALTANAMAGDREKCLAAGMDDYLSKPVSLQALLEAINRVQGPAPVPVAAK